uniref:Uncharacterized protein n=1 Tax=Panagrolaimus sp. ES5 TaxID=591445 RepID=A0AC34G1K0_9BILA
MKIIATVLVVALLGSSNAFLLPSSGGGCCPPPPTCGCAAPPLPPPPVPCGNAPIASGCGGGSYAAPPQFAPAPIGGAPQFAPQQHQQGGYAQAPLSGPIGQGPIQQQGPIGGGQYATAGKK